LAGALGAGKQPVLFAEGDRSDDVFDRIIVCALLRRIGFVGANPTRLTFAPAGSTWGGSGGNEWAEALQEKVSLGDQRAMRAVTRVNTEQASKGRCGSRPAIITGKAAVLAALSDMAAGVPSG